ncbi:glycosyltransferase family 2 protein [Patescibacteria group bacterium]|nr:glycosyltransferase family 2 protein [Patescibacteria group bacterium]
MKPKSATSSSLRPAYQIGRASATNTKLVIIVPALNEARTIQRVINSIPRNLAGIANTTVVVIDDGSSDDTALLATQAGATVVSHQQNLGVGAAFHTGLKEALARGADVIVNIDADDQFNSQDIPLLIAPILAGQAQFVTASRFAKPDLVEGMPAIKKWGNRWMVRIINFLTKRNFTDVSCGFRAYSRDAALRLTLFGHFTYTQETFIDLAFKNISMMEIPISARGEREYGKSRVASNLWRYGIKSATIIFRAARDYRPQYFFGLPGLLVLAVGLASGLFLLWHFLNTGQTYPYRSLVQVSGVLIIVGILLLFLSMIADMLHRNRVIAEEAVYYARKAAYAKNGNQE